LLLIYALFFTGDEASDSEFIPPKSRRGKYHMFETGGSQGGDRIKHKAKRKKAPAPRPSSGDDEEREYDDFSRDIEHHDPKYVPNVDLKTCELYIWTNLRQEDPYRTTDPPFT
jgi:hypothetical protein